MASIFISPAQAFLLHSRQPILHFCLQVKYSIQTELPFFSLNLPQIQSSPSHLVVAPSNIHAKKKVGVISDLSLSHLAFLVLSYLENISRIKSLLTTCIAFEAGPGHLISSLDFCSQPPNWPSCFFPSSLWSFSTQQLDSITCPLKTLQ